MKLSDFKDYKAIVKEPIEIELGSKFKALVLPPPSGGIITGFILRLMNRILSFFICFI